MLKPLVPKFCLHLFVRVKDIAEKHVPAKLKPIVKCDAFREQFFFSASLQRHSLVCCS